MFPGDYLARYGDGFGKSGFRRLIRNGSNFTNARLSYGNTQTAPGHSTIVTGAVPADHGIVSNFWYRPGSDAAIECVYDTNYITVGPVEFFDSDGYSPANLVAPTIGDELKHEYGKDAKVWAVSLKARSAVLSGGKSADGAVWFTPKSGDFVSSTYYAPLVPEWVRQLNVDRYADQFLGKVWDHLLPLEAYKNCDIDDAPYETGPRVLFMNVLPKTLGKAMPSANRVYFEQLQVTPFGNELVFKAAREAVVNEKLGQDDTPDLLVVSLSSTDYCGHLFGPDSHEMFDMMARTDRQVASWLEFLDKNVGADHYVLALTGDHGVGPSPERMEAAGKGGGRIDLDELFGQLHQAIADKFGPTAEDIYYISAIDLPWVYLNEPVLKFHGIDLHEAAEVVAQFAERHDGIDKAVIAARAGGETTKSRMTALEKAVANDEYQERSGHVYLQLARYWYRTGVCAGHGTTYDYDAHVPFVLTGPGFKTRSFDKPIDVRDLAPTLSKVLGISAPEKSSGRVLTESLR